MFFHNLFDRYPTNTKLKEQWIEIIRIVNGENFNGAAGFVCEKHFSSKQIVYQKDKCMLKENAFPDLILINSKRSIPANNINDIETSNNSDALKAKILKVKLDHEIEIIKLKEQLKLSKEKLAATEIQNERMKMEIKLLRDDNDALKSKFTSTSDNAKVILK